MLCLFSFGGRVFRLLLEFSGCRKMVSRLLIGNNNLSRFWPAHQFGCPNLKGSSLLTATDLDTLDHALTQLEDREQVIISMLTSVILDEVNALEVSSSAFNVCSEVVQRLVGLCPQSPQCQVLIMSCPVQSG